MHPRELCIRASAHPPPSDPNRMGSTEDVFILRLHARLLVSVNEIFK
jgi:hypothetical protein